MLREGRGEDCLAWAVFGLAVVAVGLVLTLAVLGSAHADPAPTLLWERHPGSVEYDYGMAVAIDTAGNIVVGGRTLVR